MIQGNETIQKYTLQNKIYIPTQYYNENYKYTISNDEVTIITNNNCRVSYNTTYCNCIRYNERYNIATNTYECNANPNNYLIDYQYITDDINYSYRITNDFVNNYIIIFGIIIIAILFAIFMKKTGVKI